MCNIRVFNHQIHANHQYRSPSLFNSVTILSLHTQHNSLSTDTQTQLLTINSEANNQLHHNSPSTQKLTRTHTPSTLFTLLPFPFNERTHKLTPTDTGTTITAAALSKRIFPLDDAYARLSERVLEAEAEEGARRPVRLHLDGPSRRAARRLAGLLAVLHGGGGSQCRRPGGTQRLVCRATGAAAAAAAAGRRGSADSMAARPSCNRHGPRRSDAAGRDHRRQMEARGTGRGAHCTGPTARANAGDRPPRN